MVAVAKKKKKKKADQTAAGATAPASMGSDAGLLRVSNPIMEGGGTVQVEASGFEGSNDDTYENELGEDQGEIAVAQSPRRKNYTGRSGKQLWQILRAEATTITTMTAMWGASHRPPSSPFYGVVLPSGSESVVRASGPALGIPSADFA